MGLSDNQVTTVVRDQRGLLWVGTGEGLNVYDGYTVTRYYKEDYPAMGSNFINGLACDEKNRIWFRNSEGRMVVIDAKRKFTSVPVLYKGTPVQVRSLRQTKNRGLLLFRGKQLFTLKEKDSLYFEQVNWKEDTALEHAFTQIVNDGEDQFMMMGNGKFVLFDARNLKVIFQLQIPSVICAARLNADELLVTTEKNRELLVVSTSQKKVVRNYGYLKDQYGEPINGYLRYMRRVSTGEIIMSSGYGGIYVFDPVTGKLNRHEHNPLNNRTVAATNTSFVITDSSGYVFIATRSAGLSYFNIHYRMATHYPSFQENTSGKIFHGFVNFITQHPNGNFWLGTQTGLVEWNRAAGKTIFHDYGFADGIPLKGVEEIRTLLFDNEDKLWAGMNRYGLVVLDKNRKVLRYLTADSLKEKGNHIPGNFVNRIVQGPDGLLWVATASGTCTIDPHTYRVNHLQKHPQLFPLGAVYTYNIWFRSENEIWFATSRGAYRFQLQQKKLKLFNTANGLPANSTICFTEDASGKIYIGTSGGMAVVKNDTIIKVLNRANGLRSDRCQGFITDAAGRIWIGNDNALICYNPENGSCKPYDESYGISSYGTRLLSFYQAPDGEQFWGSDVGLSSFYPDQLSRLVFPLQVNLGPVLAGGEPANAEPDGLLRLPYSKRNLQFSFSAIDLFSSRNISWQYKLEGFDPDWKNTGAPQLVNYSGLTPGKYSFRARASRDGVHWVEAAGPVTIQITTPWWRSAWFIGLIVLAILFIIFIILRNHSRKLTRQKEDLDTQQAINHFASSIHEQKTEEDILWDITRNCISRLGFEDCVIYLKDEQRNVLIQKAAWGPKTNEELQSQGDGGKIINPLEIPLGKGITGTVAQTARAEIIADTSKDSRYIVDDERRFSEITVPIVYNGTVIGVIDSEHTKKNFFTSRHLFILNTIATICANKIMRSRSENARQKAQLELLEHRRIMAEAQLKSLRLQMSPHFLFNALNSIQQIILSGNEEAATKYLSRFSRLLRLVLQHSDREKISLKEETETLGLYLELESLRFDDSFAYSIETDPGLDTEEIKIPTLLIQPFVENAIWHGLLHKEGKRVLKIKFMEEHPDIITCIVEDNGIGRKASKAWRQTDEHTGKGLSVAAERIRSFNEQHQQKSYFEIDDLTDEKGAASGTRVRLFLPLSKP